MDAFTLILHKVLFDDHDVSHGDGSSSIFISHALCPHASCHTKSLNEPEESVTSQCLLVVILVEKFSC